MTQLTIHTQLHLDDIVLAEGNSEDVHGSIMKIVTMLPQECQNSFYLATVHGLSDKEVAQFINSTRTTVREHMNMAIRYIRENVREIRSETGVGDDLPLAPPEGESNNEP